MKKIILAFFTLHSLWCQAALVGNDDRKERHQVHSEMMKESAKSVAAMIDRFNFNFIQDSNNEELSEEAYRQRWNQQKQFRLSSSSTLVSSKNLCTDARFATQPDIATCTAFLVADDLLLTAGHCFDLRGQTPEEVCNTYKWVFDYRMDEENVFQNIVPASNVYSCKKVLKYAYGAKIQKVPFINQFFNRNDFTIIQLDRKVENRKPLRLAKNIEEISPNAPVFTIGYPDGLPEKIVDVGHIVSTPRYQIGKSFPTTLDAFVGQSGSPIFNAETGNVIGILTEDSGVPDYEAKTSATGCLNPFVVPEPVRLSTKNYGAVGLSIFDIADSFK